MSRVYASLRNWAKKTSAMLSCEAGLDPGPSTPRAGQDLIYRLKHWPHLPAISKTAGTYRALSIMSNRPVNRRWILANTKLSPDQVDSLLQSLIDEGAVEVIDSSRFELGR